MADLPHDATDASLGVPGWDWENILDFSFGLDSPARPDVSIFPWHSEEAPATFNSEHPLLPSQGPEAQVEASSLADLLADGPPAEGQGVTKRTRKRDPRLTCVNFLAGRVPCACPEMEENEEEEVTRKRAKVVTRCQVPGCEADISHLKDYHRRHRVCLRCVNSPVVTLDDLPQRYCQQCGKFHQLQDFDEGKRSCRRKLEWHNKIRRRKSAVVIKDSMQRQNSRTQSPLQNEDGETRTDDKSGQGSKSISSLGMGEKQASSGSDEMRISEVEQQYGDCLSVDAVEAMSADAVNVPRRLTLVKTYIETEGTGANAGREYPDSDLEGGENFNDQNIRPVENNQALPSKVLLTAPQDGDNGSTRAGLNEQSYTGLLMEENSHKDRFLHNSSCGSHGRDEGGEPLRSSLSSTGYVNQLSYTSVCPTGRISFKLYDWNPAEFPRRLRQQILQWLASMPLELEGYIRPGCTILTAFIALPRFMWEKLSMDATGYVHNLVNGSESILWGKGNMLVYLNDMVMQIEKGEASFLSIKMEQRVPRLYSVHPMCFEAGRPIEIVVCGRNLFQRKFRFLISFGGKYLHYDSCETIPHRKTDSASGSKENICEASDYDFCKIHIPSTDSRLFGPAFIEVENEYGISNFIPILIGDKQICSEFQMIEQELDKSTLCCGRKSQLLRVENFVCEICRLNIVKQQSVLELLLDIGWVLKEPEPDENEIPVNYAHVQRLNCLFSFLMSGRSLAVTKQILHSPKVVITLSKVSGNPNEFNDIDINLLQKYVEHARLSISYNQPEYIGKTSFQKFSENMILQGHLSPLDHSSICRDQVICKESNVGQEMEPSLKIQTEVNSSTGLESDDSHILPVEENNMLMPLLEEGPFNNLSSDLKQNSKWEIPKIIHVAGCTQRLKINLYRDLRIDRRMFILTITVLAICAGVCVVLQHPHQVMEISMSVRRCLLHMRNDGKGALVP